MSYYTAFVYKNKSAKDLHCTHKYLGRLETNQVRGVIEAIDVNFRIYAASFPHIRFIEVIKLGPTGASRALKPSSKTELEASGSIWTAIRDCLAGYREDEYDYNPHVTTKDLIMVDEPFYGYALIHNNEIIRFWENKAYENCKGKL